MRFVLNPAIFIVIFAVSVAAWAEGSSTKELPVFTDSGDSVGLSYIGTMGQTAVWADFDSDGWQDILISNTDRSRRIRRNPRNKRKRRRTEYPSTLSTARTRHLYLFRNEEGSKFSDVAFISGLPNEGIKTASWADYDNDGFLDLAITTIRAASPPLLFKNLDGFSFTEVSKDAGITLNESTLKHAIWSDYDRDGLVDLFLPGIPYSHLYRNQGDGTFEEVSSRAALRGQFSTLSALWFDTNNDGYQDLFLANGGFNKFFFNNGDGTFTDATLSSGLEGGLHWRTTSACSGDYNGDGFLDLYVTNIGKAKRNALYRNNKDGTFTDVTWLANTPDVGDGRTCAWIDFDADGRVDLFSTNHVAYNKLYRNLGNGLFQDVAAVTGVDTPIDVFAATWGDYDRDGFLDVYLNGHIGTALKRNSGNSNNSITLHLVGDGLLSNRSAIGARVQLSTPEGTQIREVSGGRGGVEQDMLPLYFGLGRFDKADISVKWPSGKICTFNKVPIGTEREYQVRETKCDIIALKSANN
jgi:hypothetical protein